MELSALHGMTRDEGVQMGRPRIQWKRQLGMGDLRNPVPKALYKATR